MARRLVLSFLAVLLLAGCGAPLDPPPAAVAVFDSAGVLSPEIEAELGVGLTRSSLVLYESAEHPDRDIARLRAAWGPDRILLLVDLRTYVVTLDPLLPGAEALTEAVADALIVQDPVRAARLGVAGLRDLEAGRVVTVPPSASARPLLWGLLFYLLPFAAALVLLFRRDERP
jgi:hypothetical protein